jgi:hypothetical protein
LFALQLVGRDLALLCLLFLINLANLGDLLLTRLLNAAESFGAEVRSGSQVVRKTKEVLEEWEGGGVVRGKLEGKIDSLLGLGVVETESC